MAGIEKKGMKGSMESRLRSEVSTGTTGIGEDGNQGLILVDDAEIWSMLIFKRFSHFGDNGGRLTKRHGRRLPEA